MCMNNVRFQDTLHINEYVNSQNKRYSKLSREVPLHTFMVYVRRIMGPFSFHGHKIHTNMLHMFWRHFYTLVRSGENTGLRLFVFFWRDSSPANTAKNPYIFQRRVLQVFRRSGNQFIGARRVTCSTDRTGNPQILGAAVQNLVARPPDAPDLYTPVWM
jgi:hypothetical protein